MLLLVTTAHPDMERYAHPNLGRLVQPRHYSSIATTAAAGIPWAADNDCFQGLDALAYERMLEAIDGLDGCLFVTVPDVVGNHKATLKLWHEWRGRITQPAAFVLQDGCDEIPGDADAVFVGGTSLFKLGDQVVRLVSEAKRLGLWAHMGRVNTARRVMHAKAIGCDSVDGSKWARWKQTWLQEGLLLVSQPPQGRIGEEQ